MVHSLLTDQAKRNELSLAIKKLAKPEAAKDIVKVMDELIQ
jgi:UDP-N-acetylglucosamine--N-acetylmuramyl-(pentapeptide) pyrophosphoryl-undecaprenol N-acetylglucosamine transferase